MTKQPHSDSAARAAFSPFTLALPGYVTELLPGPEEVFSSPADRMAFAVLLARTNSERGGGPFGAAIFECGSGRLLAPGVNLVVPSGCSIMHAEMVAILFAEQTAGTFNLSEVGAFELVTSAEPCAQCYGAIPWSGVRGVTYGATKADVEAIGFAEGPKPRSWKARYREMGIEVHGPLSRAAARRVLDEYGAAGQPIYNGGNTDSTGKTGGAS